ncbi:hypothetical protein [uncultured Algibacter sp.]|uniref:hypothetical protein n=1 Tax=uncultured Algibacter sp. TaxID=298659 RepID=UPI002607D912|nr:hypothetical protein [uncultured Algibacter sp.]
MKQFIKNTILITICIFLVNCSSDSNSDKDGPKTVNTDNYLYFISGEVDGESFLYGLETEPTSIEYTNVFGKSGVCTSDNTSYGGINYNSGVYPSFSGGSSIFFDFVRFYLCSSSQSKLELFNDSFPVKSYPLSVSDNTISGTNGSIAISYSPNVNNDLYYTSFNGSSINGSFTITKSTEKNQFLLNQLIDAYQEIEGTFSGTLYNVEDSSDTVEITNGAFKLQVKLL